MLNISIKHSEQTSVGEIHHCLTFGQQEVKALKFLMSDSVDLRPEFLVLWGSIVRYESATFGLKELMPTIVNRLQKTAQFKELEPRLMSDFLILQGLPKYTWTKNWFARNQLIKIAEKLKKNQIEFVLLKGIAETFLDPDALTARTCRDIDILINPNQLGQFARVVMTLGWACNDLTPGALTNPALFAGNAFTFRHPAGIVDLDVHFSGASIGWSSYEKFVQQIWNETRTINSDLLIPSAKCRLLITVWNIFDVENIKSQQILKYFYDFMRQSKSMDLHDKLAFVRAAESNLNLGKQALRLLALHAQINKSWHQYFLFVLLLGLTPPQLVKPRIRVSEQIYFWLYHTKNIVISRRNSPLRWDQMLFNTIVESDTYRARRDSYLSILKTKRDHLKSFLLNRLWNTKIFFKTHANRPLFIIYKSTKTSTLFTSKIVLSGILFLYNRTISVTLGLKNYYLSMRRNNENKMSPQNDFGTTIRHVRAQRTYFVSSNYFINDLKVQRDHHE